MVNYSVNCDNVSAIITSDYTTIQVGNYNLDNAPWVYIPPGASATLSLTGVYYPTPSSSYVMKNLSGTVSSQAFDSRHATTYSTIGGSTLPLILSANDVVLLAAKSPGTNGFNTQRSLSGENIGSVYNPLSPVYRGGREFYNGDYYYSYIDELVPLTVVSSLPTSASIRPGAFGSIFERTNYSLSDVDLGKLPMPALPYTIGQSPPWSEALQSFSRFFFPYLNSRDCAAVLPKWQSVGTHTPTVISDALLKLLEPTVTPSDTRWRNLLTYRLVQIGLDAWTAYKSGRRTPYNQYWGANPNDTSPWTQQGYKALIILAGVLLNDANMSNPDLWFQNNGVSNEVSGTTNRASVFQENGIYYEADAGSSNLSSTWWGGRWAYQDRAVSTQFYTTTVSSVTARPTIRSYQALSPSGYASGIWSPSGGLSANYSPANSYITHNVITQKYTGTTLFMYAMDKIIEWSKSLAGGVNANWEFNRPFIGRNDVVLSSVYNFPNGAPGFWYGPNITGFLTYFDRYFKGPDGAYGYTSPSGYGFVRPTSYLAFPEGRGQGRAPWSNYGTLGAFYRFRAQDYHYWAWTNFRKNPEFVTNNRGITGILGVRENVNIFPNNIGNATSGSGGFLITTDTINYGKIRFEIFDAPTNRENAGYSATLVLGNVISPTPYLAGGNTVSSCATAYVSGSVPYSTQNKVIAPNPYGNYVVEVDLSSFDPQFTAVGSISNWPSQVSQIGVQLYWDSGQASNALVLTPI